MDKKVSYCKFTKFPVVYSHFTVSEEDPIIDEARSFLVEFLNALKPKITDEQFNNWWPKELVYFKGEEPTVAKTPNKELLKSDMRWWVTMVFNFFTVLVFGMALIGLVVTMENIATSLAISEKVGWLISAYFALSWIFAIVGFIGMGYFAFRAFQAYKVVRERREKP